MAAAVPFARSPFVGYWQAIDYDGSDIHLVILRTFDGSFRLTWWENYFTFCEGPRGFVWGTGQVDPGAPDVLEADLHIRCFGTGNSAEFHADLRYDDYTDTLSSASPDLGPMVITWHRYNTELPFRKITALPAIDQVQGWGWEVGSAVHMILLDPEGGVVLEVADEPQVPEWDPSTTYVQFDLEGYDLTAGDHIRMTDGHLTRDLWPTNLEVVDVNLGDQTVSGIAEPASAVGVEVFVDPPLSSQAITDEDGNWVATFAEMPRGSWGEAIQDDVDGDQTRAQFGIPDPRIVASEAGDWFWTTEFRPGALAVSIYASGDPGATLLWTDSIEADEWGFAIVGYENHGLDLLPGHFVVVTDGVTEKGLILETITMDVFDTTGDFMAGSAPPGREVWAAAGPQEWQERIRDVADPVTGAWEADFTTIGFDITEEMRPWSFAQIFDEDGDANEASTPPLSSMEALILAAQQEGSLTVIALPRDWCNYGAIIDGFTDSFGIPVNSIAPGAGSADELQAIREGGPEAPDVIDVGAGFALQAQAEGLLAPYQVAEWDTIPESMRDPDGFWYGDYYGVVAIAANTGFTQAPGSWEDLRSGDGIAPVALGGDPTISNMGFFSVYGATLANEGDLDNIEPGLWFFRDLQSAGRLLPQIGGGDTLLSGETPVLLEWSYLALAQQDANPGALIVVAVPQPAIASFYAQAISASAPHPNAARLWMEYLYSDAGQLGFAQGYCLPALFEDMRGRGVIPEDLLSRLPDPSGAEFPSVSQAENAKAFVEANWACTVYGAGCTPPELFLRVNYGHDWVESFYEPGRTVWITVYESDHETVRATAEVTTASDGSFQTQPEAWYPGQPDIQPLDWVSAVTDNGQTAQVQIGDVWGGIDLDADRAYGTIDAPWITDPVSVECLDWGSGAGPFNKDAGVVLANGADPYSCSWDPVAEWDIQPGQDVGVGYFGPDGHWVANAFRAQDWVGAFTFDAGTWDVGEHSYWSSWEFTEPAPGGSGQGDVTPFSVSEGARTYSGLVLLRGGRLLTGDGEVCFNIEPADPANPDSHPAIRPDQPTRFVWLWLTDYPMTYDQAQSHFASFEVWEHWDEGGSAQLQMHPIIPGADLPGYDCSFVLP